MSISREIGDSVERFRAYIDRLISLLRIHNVDSVSKLNDAFRRNREFSNEWKSIWRDLAEADGGKIGLPEVNLGVLPGTGGTQRLCRIVGKSHAIELMATGTVFDFDEGLDKNLVNQVFEAESAEDFMAQAMEYAKQFTTPNKASKAVGNIKRAVQTGIGLPFEQALTLERELQQQLFASHDAKEGISAYVEKRTAQFEGR